MAKILDQTDIDSIELNISCPNVKNGGLAFGTNPKVVQEVVSRVRKSTQKHLMVKLSPNVTDIKEIARIVEAEGADCISLINTVSGMAIDIYKRQTVLKRGSGGLSGPAIKPVALKLVNDVYQSVKIPILGMGGIATHEDAVEFLLAGASAIAVGTASFSNPKAPMEILEGIQRYMTKMGYDSVKQITGDLK
jgi:dihydroorotate dehydrogenase (NAD+) catalytic subunit